MFSKHQLLLAGLFLVWLVFLLMHFYFVSTNLYWKVWWLDLPMHIFGGALIIVSWYKLNLVVCFERLALPSHPLFWLLVLVLGWEIFKYAIDITVREGYLVDTGIDVVLGMGGGLIAELLQRSRRIGK